MEYVSPEGLRQDGRRAQELRQLKCEIGLLNKADGSATFEMGNTKVLTAFRGVKLSCSSALVPTDSLRWSFARSLQQFWAQNPGRVLPACSHRGR